LTHILGELWEKHWGLEVMPFFSNAPLAAAEGAV